MSILQRALENNQTEYAALLIAYGLISATITRNAGKKKKKGAPKGNQNARKHGFYSQALDAAERVNFDSTLDCDGLAEGDRAFPHMIQLSTH